MTCPDERLLHAFLSEFDTFTSFRAILNTTRDTEFMRALCGVQRLS